MFGLGHCLVYSQGGWQVGRAERPDEVALNSDDDATTRLVSICTLCISNVKSMEIPPRCGIHAPLKYRCYFYDTPSSVICFLHGQPLRILGSAYLLFLRCIYGVTKIK